MYGQNLNGSLTSISGQNLNGSLISLRKSFKALKHKKQAKIYQSSIQCLYKVYKQRYFKVHFNVCTKSTRSIQHMGFHCIHRKTKSLYCTRRQSFYNHKDGLYDHNKIIRLYSKVVKAMYEVVNHDIIIFSGIIKYHNM